MNWKGSLFTTLLCLTALVANVPCSASEMAAQSNRHGVGGKTRDALSGRIEQVRTPSPRNQNTTELPPDSQTSTVSVSSDRRISVRFDNRQPGDILRMLSERRLFDISGPLPSGEPTTIAFSELTLQQALTKILRGYNYTLMDRGQGQTPVLMVMGKVDANRAAEPRAVPQPAAEPVNQQPDPKSYYVPPTVVEQQPASAGAPATRPGRGRPTTVTGASGVEQPGGSSQNAAVQPARGTDGPVPGPNEPGPGEQVPISDVPRTQQLPGPTAGGPVREPAEGFVGPDAGPQTTSAPARRP